MMQWRIGIVICAVTPIGAAYAQCDPGEVAKIPAAFTWYSGCGFYGDQNISISSDIALIGDWGDDEIATNAGAAYVYERIGGVWTATAKLLASDGAEGDRLGFAVAIDGDVAILSAVGSFPCWPPPPAIGSAYIFERFGGAWAQTARLFPADGTKDDYFGNAVAVSGHTAIVGAEDHYHDGDNTGAAYVFEKVGGEWKQTAELLASDGRWGDFFGCSVSISGDTIIVGAYATDEPRLQAGSAYIFEREGGVWNEVTKLPFSRGTGYEDHFGQSVSISGDAAIVGASVWHRDFRGAASIYERVGGAWIEQRTFVGARDDDLGSSVSISGDIALAGVRYADDLATDAGAALVIEKIDGVWTKTARLLASDGGELDRFGSNVALDGQTALVRSPGDDLGSAYLFDLNCTCYADCDGDGELTFFDFLCFQNLFAAGDPAADCDGDGTLTFFDFLCFQNEFAAGCSG